MCYYGICSGPYTTLPAELHVLPAELHENSKRQLLPSRPHRLHKLGIPILKPVLIYNLIQALYYFILPLYSHTIL